jgi:serine/threonine protein kinase
MEEEPKTPPRSENLRESRLNEDIFINKLYFSKYRAIRKLGEGSFGKVYKAEYKGEYYALKFESRSEGQSLLENEATIMSYLKGPNIPSIKSFGYNNDYNILVMELMGKSLEDIFNAKNKFSVKTTAMLGYQMLNVLQFIHDRHIIHRDIKPDNFVMGCEEKNAILYLLDFGLAKKYRSSKTLIQYPYIKRKKLTGTARYASIHALEEMEQSRRDDLESAGYVLMYFLRGSLPWQGLRIKTKEDRYKKILEKKKETTSEVLCKNFPEEFKYYVEYTKNLGYTEDPDYDKLRNNFLYLVREKMGENFDFIYDWTSKSDFKKREDNYEENILNNGNIKINKKSDGNSGEMKNLKNNFTANKTRAEPEENNELDVDYYDYDDKKNLNKKREQENEKEKSSDNKVESKCCIM